MYFFKSLLFISFTVYCISLTSAQLSRYRNITNDDFRNMCDINNVNLDELKAINTVERRFSSYLKPNENPEKIKHCLGSSLKIDLLHNMNVVKECVQGFIELDESSIQQLIDVSEERLCALLRLATYELYLHEMHSKRIKNIEKQNFDEVDSNTSNHNKCYNILDETTLENYKEYDNLGLSYSEEGVKIYTELFKCAFNEVKKNYNIDQNEKREQLMKEYLATLRVYNTESTQQFAKQ